MVEFEYEKDNIELIHKIAQIPAFEPFDRKILQGLLQVAASRMRKYAPGELIIEEESLDCFIYFLVSGKVRIVKKGKELSIIRRKGDVFGEMGVIDGSTRSASVYAADETVCLLIDACQIDRLTGDDRLAFGYVLFRIMAEMLANRLRITNDELVKAKDEAELLRCKLDVNIKS